MIDFILYEVLLPFTVTLAILLLCIIFYEKGARK